MEKNWFKRHPILTIIFGIVVLAIIFGGVGEEKEDKEKTPKINPMDKTANFTMDDCFEICSNYPMAVNENICKGNCNMYGQPSNKLDTFCLASIKSVNYARS